nr:hypothetical protein [Tanacetum cinerariifolium]
MHVLMLGMKGIGGRGLSDHVAARVVGVRKVCALTPQCSFCCNVSFFRFSDSKVSRKITSILKTMFNGSWTTWKEVDKLARDELWVHFKELLKWEGLTDVSVHDALENSMKKRYPDIGMDGCKQMPPTAAELLELTHTKKGAFITLKSERVAAAYNGALVDKHESDHANHPRVKKLKEEMKVEIKEEMKNELKEEMHKELKE